jgi:hypothetical protein
VPRLGTPAHVGQLFERLELAGCVASRISFSARLISVAFVPSTSDCCRHLDG